MSEPVIKECSLGSSSSSFPLGISKNHDLKKSATAQNISQAYRIFELGCFQLWNNCVLLYYIYYF